MAKNITFKKRKKAFPKQAIAAICVVVAAVLVAVGFIVVKNDGEVLAYHLYNRDKFKKYLFDNTKFERGSTSRHEYATIYKSDGKMFINLNLQIRFK